MESGAIVVNEVNRYNNEKLKDLKKRKYFESFPPGYRFRPEDSELIVHYLKKKVRFVELPPNKFQEVNLYRYNPKQLIANHPIQGEKETEWYFLTPRERKYKNGLRPNRAAGDGYWKATGADKSIIDNGTTVGFRKALVFYKGKPPDGKKTNWIMHEFRDNEPPQLKNDENDMKLDDWVLCRVYKKEDKKKKQDKNNGKGELVGNPEANSQYVHGNEENSELVLVNEENSKHVHANAEISQHVHVNEFVEMNYDYNGIMGDSNGFMSIFNNDYWQLPFQYEPQGIQQFVAPQLHDFQTGLLQDTIPQQFAAPPINYRPPLIQPSETTLQSECLQEEKPTEIKEDMGSHTDNEYFDLDG